jgi:hypothetical protein
MAMFGVCDIISDACLANNFVILCSSLLATPFMCVLKLSVEHVAKGRNKYVMDLLFHSEDICNQFPLKFSDAAFRGRITE